MRRTTLTSLLLMLLTQAGILGDDHGKRKEQGRGEGRGGERHEARKEQGRDNRPTEARHSSRERNKGQQQQSWGGQRSAEQRPGAGRQRAVENNHRAIWQRSPSMSRTIRPSINSHIYNNTQRNSSQRSLYRQWDGQRDKERSRDFSRGRRDNETREQMRRFIKTRPIPRHNERAAAGRGIQEQQREVAPQFRAREQNIRDHVNKRYKGRRQWFNNNFWVAHRYYPRYYGAHHNWWGGATALGISSWLGWNNVPYFYDTYVDYGDAAAGWAPGEVYAANEVPLVDYSQQTLNIDRDEDSSGEWMPLGVFSIIQDGESETSANLFVQLALSKDGSIAGTLYDASTDQVFEVDGIVDESTQRAVWKIPALSDSPIMESGLYNLSQGAAPSRLYFSNGQAQNRLLIRMDEER